MRSPGSAALLGRVLGATALLCGGVAALGPTGAQAQDVPYLGEIMFVAFPFCPASNWVEARGQLLPIAQNTALFSLLGTTYGGNGTTTFALPDLRLPDLQGVISKVEGLLGQGPPQGGEPGATEGPPLRACIAVQGIYPARP
jgi:microcystin-dependent protein